MGQHTLVHYLITITMADAAKPAKKKAPAKKAAHPPYKAMIAAALKGLKERGGSSRQAFLKHVVANNKVDAAKAAVQVRLALKRGLAKGTLKKARASGKGAGKYKLVAVKAKKPKKKKAKKPKKKKASKKPKAKKPKAKKAAKKPAKKAAKKPAKKAAKKAAPKKK